MKHWKDDDELFSIARKELFTALVGDSLDKMGLLHQFLPQGVKPLAPGMVVIGRAMPVLEADVFAERGDGAAGELSRPEALGHREFFLGYKRFECKKENICIGIADPFRSR